MPKVPLLEQRQEPSATRLPRAGAVSGDTSVFEAQQGLGQAVAEVGDEVSKRVLQLQRQKNTNAVINAKNSANVQINDFYQNWKTGLTGEDTDKDMDALEGGISDAIKQATKDITVPDQQNALVGEMSNLKNKYLLNGSTDAKNAFMTHSATTLSNSLDIIASQAASTNDVRELVGVEDAAHADIQANIDSGVWLSPTAGEEMMNEFSDRFWKDNFKQKLRDFPDEAISEWRSDDVLADGKTWKQHMEQDDLETLGALVDSTEKTNLVDKVKTQTRIDKAARQDRKDLIEKNDQNVYGDYINGRLTRTRLEELNDTRQISGTMYTKVTDMMRGRTLEVDDPFTLAEIDTAIAYDRNPGEKLLSAVRQHKIKGETYQGYIKNFVNDEYKTALKRVVDAIDPSRFEAAYAPDMALRYDDATQAFRAKVAEGKSPRVAAQEVLDIYIQDVRRTMKGILAPTYLDGKKDDILALEQARKDTVKAYSDKIIGEREYQTEIKRIEDLINYASATSDVDLSPEDRERKPKEK